MTRLRAVLWGIAWRLMVIVGGWMLVATLTTDRSPKPPHVVHVVAVYHRCAQKCVTTHDAAGVQHTHLVERPKGCAPDDFMTVGENWRCLPRKGVTP